MMKVKLSQKGWIVIPAALRKKYGLEPGDDLQVVDYGGVLAIIPAAEDPIAAGAGMLKGADSLTEALVTEHHLERQRDS
ncbi:MAG: AbrB/MazE/SpoVT family DNA-binding domain-containing protein [Anaerolineales bacterium]|nr:AbrB/MazE/SpoVT family DNA-binding domain-containing protein [Anaerolineales bacterium]